MAEACRGDEELRRKVELLLAQDVSNDDARGDKILDRPAAELLEESTVTQLAWIAMLNGRLILSGAVFRIELWEAAKSLCRTLLNGRED